MTAALEKLLVPAPLSDLCPALELED